jgi:hypothetical protein
VCGESAALVTATNRALLLPSGGDEDGVSVFFRHRHCLHFYLAGWVLIFLISATARLSALGVCRTGGVNTYPRASANPICRLNTNSCESNVPSNPSRTSASFAPRRSWLAQSPTCRAKHRDSCGRQSPCMCVRRSTHDCANVNARYEPGSAHKTLGTLRTWALNWKKILNFVAGRTSKKRTHRS